ncbi:hypothetical protein ACEWY4_018416 [Coilia grayii]|uniref:Integrase catalytic domain-containing protein n=1 Tax=Coilia grayii TaxID=363190 RepID=A0ABD1JED6_9TELE
MLNEEMKAFGGQCISLDDLMRAEKAIVVFCQHQSHKSTIYRLDPVLEDGVLRVGGRLNRAAMPEEAKRPMILVKRYGVIFTCMSTRAVHLEMAHTLDTDSCINALRRFISRRGQVTHIRSDNGTNLVGAKKELQNAISTWNKEKIHNAMLQKGIQWSFYPLQPHTMVGCGKG